MTLTNQLFFWRITALVANPDVYRIGARHDYLHQLAVAVAWRLGTLSILWLYTSFGTGTVRWRQSDIVSWQRPLRSGSKESTIGSVSGGISTIQISCACIYVVFCKFTGVRRITSGVIFGVHYDHAWHRFNILFRLPSRDPYNHAELCGYNYFVIKNQG